MFLWFCVTMSSYPVFRANIFRNTTVYCAGNVNKIPTYLYKCSHISSQNVYTIELCETIKAINENRHATL